MMLVCLECPGEQACTLNMPDDRAYRPVVCCERNEKTHLLNPTLKKPVWVVVPSREELTKENIYLDPMDREGVNEVIAHKHDLVF